MTNMKDLKFTPGPLEIWGKQTSTQIEGFYMIGPCDTAEHPYLHTAYVSSYHDAILYSKAPDMYSALLKAKNALLDLRISSEIVLDTLDEEELSQPVYSGLALSIKSAKIAISEINKVLES